MADTNHIYPLAWLPAITETLTPEQRAELQQLLDLAWDSAYHHHQGTKADLGGAYARMSFSDIEAAHRELHRSVQKDINNARRRVSRRASRVAGE